MVSNIVGKQVVELDTCPFCGGERLDNLRGDYVHCIDCGARGPYGSDDPIDAWNHRVVWDRPDESDDSPKGNA